MPRPLWIQVLVGIAFAIASTLAASYLRTPSNATTDSVSSAPPCAYSLLARTYYYMCLVVVYPGQYEGPLLLTAANTDKLCSIHECRNAVKDFAAAVTTDCTLSKGAFMSEPNVHIQYQEIQQLAATCESRTPTDAPPEETSTPPLTSTPTAHVIYGTSDDVDDTKVTLRILLVVLGSTVSIVLALWRCKQTGYF